MGEYIDATSGYPRSLILRWNGTSWSRLTSPNLGVSTQLQEVALVSSGNVWAVGDYYSSPSVGKTFTARWNGTSWSRVSSPNAGSELDRLWRASRVPGTNQVWAVGEYSASAAPVVRTLTERYC
ncbi:MAG: hypothetical protein M3281_04770 [Chloroflexota bacterium]|nr:hypothetical protein [Chloroflexota bacterium]